MNKETAIQNQIMLALSGAGCLVFRNETSGAWVGKVAHKSGDQVTLKGARMITFGLCVGSSDLVGVTPDGRFLAVEVKTTRGRVTPEQRRFIDAIVAHGGVAGVARCVNDALELIGYACDGEHHNKK